MSTLEELLHEALNPRAATPNVALARFGAKEQVQRVVDLLLSPEGTNALREVRTRQHATAPRYIKADPAPVYDEVFEEGVKALNLDGGPPVTEPDCLKCAEDIRLNGVPLTMGRMFLCPVCGNKRCPKATDHELACTDSNASGQAGSFYR